MEKENISMERFVTLLRNEPLIEAEPSIHGISPSLFSQKEGAIYYGTGLTTPRALSIGLPFDVLGMVMTAEKLRRALNLTKIIHHIADTHALSNEFASKEVVEKIAQDAEKTMSIVAAHLNIPELIVVRSSSFDNLAEYKLLMDKIETSKGDYVHRELADVLWYRTKFNMVLKIGWIIQASKVAEGFDERLYDSEYIRLFGTDLSFIYLKAGRTFDKKRPKVSPYISVPDEQRILLRADEPVREKFDRAMELWPDKTLGGAVNHLNAIVRLYERLMEPIGRATLPEKIQTIINRIFA